MSSRLASRLAATAPGAQQVAGRNPWLRRTFLEADRLPLAERGPEGGMGGSCKAKASQRARSCEYLHSAHDTRGRKPTFPQDFHTATLPCLLANDSSAQPSHIHLTGNLLLSQTHRLARTRNPGYGARHRCRCSILEPLVAGIGASSGKKRRCKQARGGTPPLSHLHALEALPRT